jgi:predicted DNA-binding mobile mystery protein A
MRHELRTREQRELDLATRQFQAARRVLTPEGGWLRMVRKTLGMHAADVAEDLEVNPSLIFQLERSEWKETITLRRLKDVAEAMECVLVYCIVPREGKFENQLEVYVKKVLRAERARFRG